MKRENKFIKLIRDGRIKNLEELKKAYRKIAKKTHPDIIGSDALVDKFIRFKNEYEEARQFLKSNDLIPENQEIVIDENYRYLFFVEMQRLYILESAQMMRNDEKIQESIRSLYDKAFFLLKKWDENYCELYRSANREYEKIKNEKRRNIISNLRKPSVYMNLRPIFFNLFKYHITGLQFYKKQLKQNLGVVILRLEENQVFALKEYLLFLIKDMDKGPALFG